MSRKFSIIATIDFNKLDNEIGEYVKRNGNFDPYIFMSEDTAEAIKNEYEVEYGLDVKDINSNVNPKGDIKNGVKAMYCGYKVFINNDLRYGIVEIR